MKIKIATAVLLAAAYAFGQYSGGGGVTSAQLATKLSISNITQTVTSDTNTVPSNLSVSNAFMFKSGNTTNIILGLTNSADSVTMTYTGGVLIFKEIYNGTTNTYNSLNN